MKIEIDIDIESIVKAALEGKATTGASVHVSTPTSAAYVRPKTVTPPEGVEWEYAAKSGKRRGPAEIALHKKEIELGRNLTPEEKGETAAHVELDEDKELKAKEETKNKLRIDEIAREGMAAASKELEEETKEESAELDAEASQGKQFVNGEEVTPKTDDLNTLEKMFNT